MRRDSPSVRRVFVRSTPVAVDSRPVLNPSWSLKARCRKPPGLLVGWERREAEKASVQSAKRSGISKNPDKPG